MPLTPEESQTITNLNQRILANVAAGKASHDGITQEEVKQALDLLRKDRAKAIAAGDTKKGGRKPRAAAAPKSTEALDTLLASKFPGMNFD